MIVLFYAVGCIAFGFLVGVVVMVMDKRREGRVTSSTENLEGKVTDQNLRLPLFLSSYTFGLNIFLALHNTEVFPPSTPWCPG